MSILSVQSALTSRYIYVCVLLKSDYRFLKARLQLQCDQIFKNVPTSIKVFIYPRIISLMIATDRLLRNQSLARKETTTDTLSIYNDHFKWINKYKYPTQ